ncbi:MAG: hypothetical protein GDA68_12360 [Nitrospira sp. CR2.1]|nr:hypothetical protein [Nitrospira sp. CR2.1]
MTQPLATPPSGFLAFLPKEYQGEFSRDWILGISPFSDQTCRQCFTVQQGQWIGVRAVEFDERDLTCETRVRLA